MTEASWPEPAPNWLESKKIWKWGWELHLFGFACLYIIVALYAVFKIFSQRKFYLSKKKLHAFFLNSMLFSFSCTRSVTLLWNPYGSESSSMTLLVLCVILHGLATACVTSAFSVLLLILLETTKLSLAPPRFQNFGFLIGIWVSNVVYVVISDITVMHFTSAKAMIFVCQVLYAVWGLVISVGFAVAAFKIRKNLGSSRETSQYNDNTSNESARMQKLTKLMCAASVVGLFLFLISIYTASSATGVFNDSGHVEIWPWFGLQTFLRFIELLMCAIIFLIALRSATKEGRVGPSVLPNSVTFQTREDSLGSTGRNQEI